MPRISEAKRAARRDQIADAALRCFLRTGYQRTSMADIITESGLSAGAIYSYYGSKQELIVSVAERLLEDRRAELEAAGTGEPLSPARIVRLLADGIRASAPLAVLIQVWGEAAVDAELRSLVQTALGRMRAAVAVSLTRWAHSRGDDLPLPPDEWARTCAPVLMSLLPGFVLQSVLIDDFDEDAFLTGLGLLLPGG